jgi:DNA-binding SARP family transcriptional activator
VIEFRILGPLEAVDDRGSIKLGGRRQRATLAILLLDANRVVSVERLADDLYAGAAPVTAVTQVQRQISELRKTLGAGFAIETRAPGYLIRLAPGQLDLGQFEERAAAGTHALARGDAGRASELLHAALALWRGTALADLDDQPFVRAARGRLEEIRLAALEHRVDADLAHGRHRELVAELEQLASEYPLRESVSRQLMLALYRSGRQAEALAVYRTARNTLAERLGLEPTAALRELERAILAQDPSLEQRPAPADPATSRAVLVLPSADDRLSDLLSVCQPLSRRQGHELILVRLLTDERDLQPTTSALNARFSSLDTEVRTAAFTSDEIADDVIRLTSNNAVDLVMLDAPSFDGTGVPSVLAAIFERCSADVAVLVGALSGSVAGGEVVVPFAGGDHDWAALELAAWLCSCAEARLTLLGTTAGPEGRDASRLLADASLAVQRVLGVSTESVLASPTDDGLGHAVAPATLVVIGISSRWSTDGIGSTRRSLIEAGHPPLLLVHRGQRPGGLAPRESDTRFTWSINTSIR